MLHATRPIPISSSRHALPRHSFSGGVRALTSLLVPVLALLLLPGCGNTLYAFQVSSASNKVEEAKELGAEKLAPYEYYFAKQHLEKAREEAANADYGDAVDLAEVSEEFADKAIRLTKEAHRGAGR